jgi:hypothetical protein
MKFRKKPVIIDAVQWFPGVEHPGVDVVPAHMSPSRVPGEFFPVPDAFYVVTIHEQRCYIQPGDWLIPEPDGIHYYPCKPDIFENTYEPVGVFYLKN